MILWGGRDHFEALKLSRLPHKSRGHMRPYPRVTFAPTPNWGRGKCDPTWGRGKCDPTWSRGKCDPGAFIEIWEARSRGRKNNLNIFYLKKCACPTSKKPDFADKIETFMKSGRSGAGDEKTICIYSIWKNALYQLSKRVRGRDRQAEVGIAFFLFGPLRPWIAFGFLILSANFGVLTVGQKHAFKDNIFCSFLPWLLAA